MQQRNKFRCLIGIVMVCLSIALFSRENPNQKGWQLLVDNKPINAEIQFRKNCRSSNKSIAGEAYRGLAFTKKFLGNYDSTMIMLFKSYIQDRNALAFKATWIHILPFSRDWIGHKIPEGYAVLKDLTAKPGHINGEALSLFTDRYVNDGKLSQAKKLMARMGVVRDFQMIGPFDNISGSGYKKVYPPEKALHFKKDYEGKDGAEVSWFPYHNTQLNGWLFTKNNYSNRHSILYYYSNIQSKKTQEVYLGFGASGTFKVFVNDNCVLADSVFRNTGTDMFMQKVTLKKGDNKLLIKIGHERKASNFLIRFIDKEGKPLSDVTYSNKSGTFSKDTSLVDNLGNSPTSDTIEAYFSKRLQVDSSDLQAALLLMEFYNSSELTDKGQRLAQAYLRRFPKSSLWHELYSESLARSLKYTKSETALKAAYNLCQTNYSAWQTELELLAKSASPRDVMQFINASPPSFHKRPRVLLYKYRYAIETKNESEALRIIEELKSTYGGVKVVVNLLATFYIARGDSKKALEIIKNYIDKKRTASDSYLVLAGIYLKMGQKGKAIKACLQCLEYSPNLPGIYYYLAKLSLQHKEYHKAEQYIEKALAIRPTSSGGISLLGTILEAQGRKDDAINVFKKSISFNYSNFVAWDHLLPLQGKPALTSLVTVPDHDSLKQLSASWEELSNEQGAIRAYIKDVFLYPSKCSRERYYIMAHLPTQNAIDMWKEYSIAYNSYYQRLNITRAFSKGKAGKETPADISRNMIAFKTLQPGDDVVIEWTIENYYRQDMAKHVWGDHDFSLPFPVFRSELRMVTPKGDSIPYAVQGEDVEINKTHSNGFAITRFSREAYKNPPPEPFALIEPPKQERVFYSTFDSWSDISKWYLNLTENKLEQTLELQQLADSLVMGTDDPKEKARRIHEYITSAIRYSFLSFRQSAWVPQPANEVLATKIGDCKDMSSLGKSLFNHAGIESDLVLVNTRDRNSVFPTYIGPNFNHCILSYTIDDKRHFVDMTDNSNISGQLPRMDQGAVALIIQKQSDSIVHLPIDAKDERSVVRKITSDLSPDGTLVRKIESYKTGVFGGDMRASYRYLSYEEQKKSLQNILIKSFPHVTVDTLILGNLDSLIDTVRYRYNYTVKNAVQIGGNTAILSLDIPDRIVGQSYPNKEKRHYPIDMTHTWFGIGTFESKETLTIPKNWRLITVPDAVSLSGEWGEYLLSVKREKSNIVIQRRASFNFRKPIEVGKSDELREIMTKISQSDNLQLMFYTK